MSDDEDEKNLRGTVFEPRFFLDLPPELSRPYVVPDGTEVFIQSTERTPEEKKCWEELWKPPPPGKRYIIGWDLGKPQCPHHFHPNIDASNCIQCKREEK